MDLILSTYLCKQPIYSLSLRKDLERSLLKAAFLLYTIALLPLLKLGTSFCRYLYCRERIGAKRLNWLQSRFPHLLLLGTRSILESFQSSGKA